MGLLGVQTNQMSAQGRQQLVDTIIKLGSHQPTPETDITVQAASSTAPANSFANLVEQNIARPDGLRRIAFAMHTVLKIRLDYNAIGRQNVLIVDEITTGDVPFYDLDIAETVAIGTAGRGEPIQQFSNVRRVHFPTGALSHVHQVAYEDIAIRRYALFDRAKERVAIGLAIAEDDAIFGSGGLVPTAASLSGNAPVSGSMISRYILAELYGSIVQNQLALGAYLMNPVLYKDILKWSANEIDQVTLNKITETGMVGGYFGAKLLLSIRCPATACYALTTPDKLGRLPERKAVEVKVFDNVERLRYAILGWEQVGFGIFNTKGVAVANIS